MWIRTQSRQCLINVDLVEISESIAIPVSIRGYQFDSEGYVLLGEYETKEKALAVLDNIQQYITNRVVANMYDVFAMPEAGGE